MMIVLAALKRKLPPRYVAAPRVHSGSLIEIDVATFEKDDPDSPFQEAGTSNGGVATAVWAPARPTFAVATDLPELDDYEVRVYDTRRGRRLVAAIEIVSPANKDRPEHRRAFVAKCVALLQQRVSVTLIDLVTTRNFNLYSELLEMIGQADPSLGAEPPHAALYAVASSANEEGRFPAGRNVGADTHPGPAAADVALVARRQPRRAARTGRVLRGNLPGPEHPVSFAGEQPLDSRRAEPPPLARLS